MNPRRPAILTITFDGATVELAMPVAVLDRFYGDAASASPRERRALVAELLATYRVPRPSYLWRGRPVDRFRALTPADQDRVAADLVVVIAQARAELAPPPRPTSPRTDTFLPPTRSAPGHYGRS